MRHVPTVEELAKRKLAVPTGWTATKKVTHWRILPEGQELIHDAMRHNALEQRAADEERRRTTPPTPPSRWDT